MRKEKLEESLNEVLDEIDISLKDIRGLTAHQTRLAFSLSLGATVLLELYLNRLSIIKDGSKINHTWFKKKKESVLEILQNQITSPTSSVPNIDIILDLIIKIEEKRDELAYGAPADEKVLQEKINLFFELKGVVRC